jgi:hypothetical protein
MTNISHSISGKPDAGVVEVMEQRAMLADLPARISCLSVLWRVTSTSKLGSTNLVRSPPRVYDLIVFSIQLVKPLLRQKSSHSICRSYGVHSAEGIGLHVIPPNNDIDGHTRPRWIRTLSAFHSSSG